MLCLLGLKPQEQPTDVGVRRQFGQLPLVDLRLALAFNRELEGLEKLLLLVGHRYAGAHRVSSPSHSTRSMSDPGQFVELNDPTPNAAHPFLVIHFARSAVAAALTTPTT